MTTKENEQYNVAMVRIEKLMPLVTEETPEDDRNSIELVLLSNLVADYEQERSHQVRPVATPKTLPLRRCVMEV